MKKIVKIVSLGLAFGLLGGVLVGANLSKDRKIAKADGPETYIPMESAFFTNWTADAGSFAGTDARFWGENYSFEALDTFFRGESAETWTGTLTSRTWKQSTQYVYFQLGGARDYEHPEGAVHLVFHYGAYSADFYNNTFVENPMTLRYFKIPDEQFATLTASESDFDMSVDIVDPCTAGYGFANFGYLHVNQTEESTSDAMRYFLNHLSNDSREWEINKRKEIFNSYWANDAQRAVFFRTVASVDDMFSSNSNFMNHWYFDWNFFNNNYNDPMHFDKAIGSDDYRPEAATNMPFNNDGSFFRGWYEGSVDAGFVASDGLRYRFISRPFVLSGTGIISIKMAGKASLHVIDATVQNTDSQAADLAWVDNKAFNSGGSNTNIAASGFNTCTMVRHVINLEEYVGKKIQLAISDYDTSGWSAAYFDSLSTSFDGFFIEYATQTNTSGTYYPVCKDIYINSKNKNNETNPYGVIYNGGNAVNTANDNEILNHEDTSDKLSAYNVWKSYLNEVRGNNQGTNYCSKLTDDGVKGVMEDYAGLSTGAKQIVCKSDDFERIGAGSWDTVEPTIYSFDDAYNIGRSIAYIASENGISVTTYSNGLVNLINNNVDAQVVIIVSVSVFLTLVATSLFIFNKKRKENN